MEVQEVQLLDEDNSQLIGLRFRFVKPDGSPSLPGPGAVQPSGAATPEETEEFAAPTTLADASEEHSRRSVDEGANLRRAIVFRDSRQPKEKPALQAGQTPTLADAVRFQDGR